MKNTVLALMSFFVCIQLMAGSGTAPEKLISQKDWISKEQDLNNQKIDESEKKQRFVGEIVKEVAVAIVVDIVKEPVEKFVKDCIDPNSKINQIDYEKTEKILHEDIFPTMP